MNTEEVVAMIDAITDGRPYEKFELNGEQINIAIRDDEFVIAGLSNDPRTAREIAGALVAWANRKDGHKIAGSVRSIIGDIRWAELKGAILGDIRRSEGWAKEGELQNHLLSEFHSSKVSVWRERWYKTHVGNMTQETKNRNLKDLVEICDTRNLAPSERADIEAAIHILRMNGAE